MLLGTTGIKAVFKYVGKIEPKSRTVRPKGKKAE